MTGKDYKKMLDKVKCSDDFRAKMEDMLSASPEEAAEYTETVRRVEPVSHRRNYAGFAAAAAAFVLVGGLGYGIYSRVRDSDDTIATEDSSDTEVRTPFPYYEHMRDTDNVGISYVHNMFSSGTIKHAEGEDARRIFDIIDSVDWKEIPEDELLITSNPELSMYFYEIGLASDEPMPTYELRVHPGGYAQYFVNVPDHQTHEYSVGSVRCYHFTPEFYDELISLLYTADDMPATHPDMIYTEAGDFIITSQPVTFVNSSEPTSSGETKYLDQTTAEEFAQYFNSFLELRPMDKAPSSGREKLITLQLDQTYYTGELTSLTFSDGGYMMLYSVDHDGTEKTWTYELTSGEFEHIRGILGFGKNATVFESPVASYDLSGCRFTYTDRNGMTESGAMGDDTAQAVAAMLSRAEYSEPTAMAGDGSGECIALKFHEGNTAPDMIMYPDGYTVFDATSTSPLWYSTDPLTYERLMHLLGLSELAVSDADANSMIDQYFTLNDAQTAVYVSQSGQFDTMRMVFGFDTYDRVKTELKKINWTRVNKDAGVLYHDYFVLDDDTNLSFRGYLQIGSTVFKAEDGADLEPLKAAVLASLSDDDRGSATAYSLLMAYRDQEAMSADISIEYLAKDIFESNSDGTYAASYSVSGTGTVARDSSGNYRINIEGSETEHGIEMGASLIRCGTKGMYAEYSSDENFSQLDSTETYAQIEGKTYRWNTCGGITPSEHWMKFYENDSPLDYFGMTKRFTDHMSNADKVTFEETGGMKVFNISIPSEGRDVRIELKQGETGDLTHYTEYVNGTLTVSLDVTDMTFGEGEAAEPEFTKAEGICFNFTPAEVSEGRLLWCEHSDSSDGEFSGTIAEEQADDYISTTLEKMIEMSDEVSGDEVPMRSYVIYITGCRSSIETYKLFRDGDTVFIERLGRYYKLDAKNSAIYDKLNEYFQKMTVFGKETNESRVGIFPF